MILSIFSSRNSSMKIPRKNSNKRSSIRRSFHHLVLITIYSGQPDKKKSQTTKNTQNGNKTYKTSSPPKSSIVNKLQNQNRHTSGPITKEDLFRPSNHRPVMFVERNSIFNVDNQQQSEDAMRELHKEYNHVSINTLKIVYLTLEKNFHSCRLFLSVTFILIFSNIIRKRKLGLKEQRPLSLCHLQDENKTSSQIGICWRHSEDNRLKRSIQNCKDGPQVKLGRKSIICMD